MKSGDFVVGPAIVHFEDRKSIRGDDVKILASGWVWIGVQPDDDEEQGNIDLYPPWRVNHVERINKE